MDEDRILEWLEKRAQGRALKPRVPLGDDAAVVDLGPGTRLAITSDALAEGVHFRREYWSWEQVGEKLLAAGLSDVQAMGGIPEGYLVSMAFPKGTPFESIESLTAGLERVAAAFDLTLLGGDTTRSEERTFLDATVIGRLSGDPVTRAGAAPGDTVYLTGCTGLSAWIWEKISRGTPAPEVRMMWARLEGGFDAEDRAASLGSHADIWDDWTRSLGLSRESGQDVSEAMQRLLTPRPPRLTSRFFAEWRPTSAIDVSDGLGRELHHIARRSGVGLRVDARALLRTAPTLSRLCRLRDEDPLPFILSSGEEYELLFTSRVEPTPETVPAATRIGTVSEGDEISLVDREGKEKPLPSSGFVHEF